VDECAADADRTRVLLNALCRPVEGHPLGEWHVVAAAPGSSSCTSARATIICRVDGFDVIALYC